MEIRHLEIFKGRLNVTPWLPVTTRARLGSVKSKRFLLMLCSWVQVKL